MKKSLKKLKTYDIENIVRNTLSVLMILNIILVIFIITLGFGENCFPLYNTRLVRFTSNMIWPVGIITYIVTIIYFVAAFKTKSDKFFKIMFAFTALSTNIMSIMLLSMGIIKLYGCA